MWGCSNTALWHDHDVTLCAQNLGLGSLFFAAVLVVSFFRMLKIYPSSGQRSLQIKSDTEGLLEEAAAPVTSLWDAWCAKVTHFVCVALVVLYAVLLVNDFNMSSLEAEGNILIGDAYSLSGWAVILTILYTENHRKRITSLSLRILVSLDFAIKVIRLRTEVPAGHIWRSSRLFVLRCESWTAR